MRHKSFLRFSVAGAFINSILLCFYKVHHYLLEVSLYCYKFDTRVNKVNIRLTFKVNIKVKIHVFSICICLAQIQRMPGLILTFYKHHRIVNKAQLLKINASSKTSDGLDIRAFQKTFFLKVHSDSVY